MSNDESRWLRFETDGTKRGTRVILPDGSELGGIMAVTFEQDWAQGGGLGHLTVQCYTRYKAPQ